MVTGLVLYAFILALFSREALQKHTKGFYGRFGAGRNGNPAGVNDDVGDYSDSPLLVPSGLANGAAPTGGAGDNGMNGGGGGVASARGSLSAPDAMMSQHSDTSATVVCSSCGKENKASANFCCSCAKQL